MSPELQQIAVQHYCHMSPSVSWGELWLRDADVYFAFWVNFDTVLCQFLKTGTSDRGLIVIVQLLRF